MGEHSDHALQNAGTAGGSSTTFARPVPLTVGNASHVIVEDITEIGSPFWVCLMARTIPGIR